MTLEEMKKMKQERGYTMAQLSEYSGVPLGTLQKIFTGETAHPRYATRQAIERVLAGEETKNPANRTEITDEHATATYNWEEIRQRIPPMYVNDPAVAYEAKREKKQGEYTIEDYYALPDDRRVELIDGVIYDMSAPESVHQRLIGEIYFEIKAYINKKGGSCIPFLSPIDVRLDCDDKTMVQPDLIIVCDESKIKKWGIMGAPEFVLEIISKSTRKKDCTKKLQKYVDAGVKEYWILDPKRKLLLTYDLINEEHDNMPCIYPLEGKVGLALYNGELEIDLSEVAGMIQEWPD